MAIIRPLTKLRQIYEKQNGEQHPAIGSTFRVSKSFYPFNRFLKNNIVEVRFVRRLEPKETGLRAKRRMLCTQNWRFIYRLYKAFPGYFNFPIIKNKKGVIKKSWYRDRNLTLVWDIVANDIRMISMDDWKIIDAQPFNTGEDLAAFMEFFDRYLKRITKIAKKRYYNK
jgi:hypothetical protein